MKYKMICFDYDYTLGDTTEGILASSRYAMEKMGGEIPDDDAVKRTIGLTLEQSYAMLTGDTEEESAKRYIEYYVQKANEVIAPSAKWLPTAKETLEKLKKAGVMTGICTTKYSHRIASILKLCNGEHLIDEVVGSDVVKNAKPSPECLYVMLERTGLAKEEILYIGDSYVDAMAAQRAGVDFIAVTSGTTTEAEFLPYDVKGVFANVGEVVDFLGV